MMTKQELEKKYSIFSNLLNTVLEVQKVEHMITDLDGKVAAENSISNIKEAIKDLYWHEIFWNTEF